MSKLKVLDLFSGIGGFSIGLERAGMETMAFCEIEKYPRKVLKKHWPKKIIHRDVRTLNGYSYRGTVDVVTGGFPCQDLSVAGNQKGINAERSGLWSELCRIIGEVRPSYAIIENVTALLSGDNGRWFQRVLWDISQIGYDAEWHCIPASELGAHHHRDRVWIIAYPKSEQDRRGIRGGVQQNIGRDSKSKVLGNYSEQFGDEREPISKTSRSVRPIWKPRGADFKKNISNTMRERLQRRQKHGIFGEGGKRWHELTSRQLCGFGDISQVEPTIRGKSNGLSNYAHRLKGLGNAVVPQIPELIGRAILS